MNETPIRVCRQCGCTAEDCSGCAAKTGEPCHWVEWDVCSACTMTHFEKMFCDPFTYLVGLRDGSVLSVHSAANLGLGWIRLTLNAPFHGHKCERDLDIREDAIMFVADAPDGS